MSKFDGIKATESFNFIRHGFYDIKNLKRRVLKLDSEWNVDTSRQKTHKIHKDTETFILQDFDLNWEPSEDFVTTKMTDDFELWDEIDPIVKDMELKHNGKVGRILLVRLKDEGNIPTHEDYGTYLSVSRRHHLPIVTTKKVFFIVNNEKRNLKEGELWEINNSKSHSVENLGQDTRIHLIFDIVPLRFIRSE